MPKAVVADVEACKSCKVGSCCYEGVDISLKEVQRIIKYNPNVPKPWFRLLDQKEILDKKYPFSTIVRNSSCVFHDENNRCMVYKVRPHFCRDFPLEDNKTAPHYKRLCVLFHADWAANSPVRRSYNQREKK